MEIDIEKALFPNSGKLIKKNGIFIAQIVDAELDPIDCVFNGDDAVEIDTSELQYITLTRENLEMLLDFIDEVEHQSEQE